MVRGKIESRFGTSTPGRNGSPIINTGENMTSIWFDYIFLLSYKKPMTVLRKHHSSSYNNPINMKVNDASSLLAYNFLGKKQTNIQVHLSWIAESHCVIL